MKKLFSVVAVAAILMSPFYSQSQSTIDGGELPEVSIICKQSFYTVTLNIYFISFTYPVSVITCNNGFEQEVDNFWN